MRDVDQDIRSSLERPTDPQGSTPGTDALWGDLVARRRRRRNRRRALAALPVLLVAVLAAGILSAQGSRDARSDVAAGDDGGSEGPEDFAPFEMTFRTRSYQGGEMVPSTWSLRYTSWTDWETTLIDGAPGVSEEPGFRRVLGDGTLTEYNPDGTVRSEDPVDGRLAPLELMSKGPRTGKGEAGDRGSTYRHEYTSRQEHECPDDPAEGAPYCEQPGEAIVVETVEVFNEDGVPIFAEGRIVDSGRVVWQFEMLTYDRHPRADPGGEPSAGVPSDGADAALGSLYEFRGQDCGNVSAGPPAWTIPPTAAECVVAAWRSGRLANLRITGPTVEGDPVTIAFQVTGQGTYDYISDSRHDAFGTKGVRLWRCKEFLGDPRELQPSFQGSAKCSPDDGEKLASVED